MSCDRLRLLSLLALLCGAVMATGCRGVWHRMRTSSLFGSSSSCSRCNSGSQYYYSTPQGSSIRQDPSGSVPSEQHQSTPPRQVQPPRPSTRGKTRGPQLPRVPPSSAYHVEEPSLFQKVKSGLQELNPFRLIRRSNSASEGMPVHSPLEPVPEPYLQQSQLPVRETVPPNRRSHPQPSPRGSTKDGEPVANIIEPWPHSPQYSSRRRLTAHARRRAGFRSVPQSPRSGVPAETPTVTSRLRVYRPARYAHPGRAHPSPVATTRQTRRHRQQPSASVSGNEFARPAFPPSGTYRTYRARTETVVGTTPPRTLPEWDGPTVKNFD